MEDFKKMNDYEIVQREINFTTFSAKAYKDLIEKMRSFTREKGLYEGDVIGMDIQRDNNTWVSTLLHAGDVVEDDNDDDDLKNDIEEKQTPTLSQDYIRVKN